MLKITIPTPCHEDWNKMSPDETGRYCNACAKSVVDFTNMNDEEVKYFFLNKKKEEKVCGRFKQTQLHRIVVELPQNIFGMQMPLWKKFLAALLIAFSTTLFSCETKIKGEPETHVQTREINATGEHVMVGGIGYSVMPDSIPLPPQCTTVGYSVQLADTSIVELQGDIALVEDTVQLAPVDTTPVNEQIKESIITGDSIYEVLPRQKAKSDSSAKTKNPPKADSVNCNTIKNYY